MNTQEDVLYIPEAEAREMVDKECFPLTTKIYNSINKVDNDTGEILLSKEKNRNCIRTFSTLSEYASFITRAIIQKCQNTDSINIDATSFCQDFVYITRHNTGLFGVAIPCNEYGDYDVLGSLYNLFFIEAPELATDNQEYFKLKEALKIVSSKWGKK